jgi:phosphatidate phosphatase PAH1
MLRNVILQTDAHNRAVEEDECWKRHNAGYASQLECKANDGHHLPSLTSNTNKDLPQIQPAADLQQRYTAHVADRDEVKSCYYDESRQNQRTTSNFWMQRFHAAESSDPNRWSHSGYVETYPQDFAASHSSSEGDVTTLKNSKSKHSCGNNKSRRHHKKKKSRERKICTSTTCSADDHIGSKCIKRRRLNSSFNKCR